MPPADPPGYSATQAFADAAAYERWVGATKESHLLADLRELGPMIIEVNPSPNPIPNLRELAPMISEVRPHVRVGPYRTPPRWRTCPRHPPPAHTPRRRRAHDGPSATHVESPNGS